MKKSLTKEQQKLIIDNYGLLKNFINKSINNKDVPENLRDEFISEMLLKFCLSASKFDESSGFKFSTYAYKGFEFGLKDIFRKREKKRDYCFTDVDYENIERYDVKQDNLHGLEISTLQDFVDSIKLKTKEKSIIEDYYYSDLSLAGIGKKHNLSKEGVRLIIKKVLKKLKFAADKNKLYMEDFYK